MVYSAQNRWLCGPHPSSGILNDKKTRHCGNWIHFPLQVKGERHLLLPTLLGPLKWANLNHWAQIQFPKHYVC
jgi:hypothetical protein